MPSIGKAWAENSFAITSFVTSGLGAWASSSAQSLIQNVLEVRRHSSTRVTNIFRSSTKVQNLRQSSFTRELKR